MSHENTNTNTNDYNKLALRVATELEALISDDEVRVAKTVWASASRADIAFEIVGEFAYDDELETVEAADSIDVIRLYARYLKAKDVNYRNSNAREFISWAGYRSTYTM